MLVITLSGPPACGKSHFANALYKEAQGRGETVLHIGDNPLSRRRLVNGLPRKSLDLLVVETSTALGGGDIAALEPLFKPFGRLVVIESST